MEKELLNTLRNKGLVPETYEETFLQRTLEKRMADCGCDDWAKYEWLLNNNPQEMSKLKECLTVSYTEFFRNQYSFAAIEKILLPLLLKSKSTSRQKELRVWSAACATGQEAYSMSMLFHENVASSSDNLKLRVFGTDVDPAQVALAMKAEYSRTNLNHVTLQRLARWFIQQGERYTLQDTIKENVEFSCFDLLDDELMYPPTSIFGGFDLVFCANLLFYYHIDAQHKILNKVNNSLNESGYLIVGEAERDILVNEGFVEILPHTGIFKKK